MGNKTVKTGRTQPGAAFAVPQVNSTYDLLNQSIDDPAFQQDTLEQNLGLARNLVTDQSDQLGSQLSRSFVGRGIGDSGLATTALNAGRGSLASGVYNEAINRAFQQKMDLMTQKNNLQQLLSNFVGSLVGTGISGQTSNYAARTGLAGQVYPRFLGIQG